MRERDKTNDIPIHAYYASLTLERHDVLSEFYGERREIKSLYVSALRSFMGNGILHTSDNSLYTQKHRIKRALITFAVIIQFSFQNDIKMFMKIEIICVAILIFAPDASIQFRRWDFHERCPLVSRKIFFGGFRVHMKIASHKS